MVTLPLAGGGTKAYPSRGMARCDGPTGHSLESDDFPDAPREFVKKASSIVGRSLTTWIKNAQRSLLNYCETSQNNQLLMICF